MAASGITPDDIDTGLDRSLTAAERARLAQWITDAETLIGLRLPGVTLDPDAYKMVARFAVEERWSGRGSAGNTSSTTVSVDDATVTKRFGEWGGSSRNGSPWWFDPDWWDLLSPASDPGAFSVRPTFTPDHAAPDAWTVLP